ncbi:uncharacterized protein LOC111703629 [Eurytemora carolleeae]|uniref:uncharacterized protein LOC111703629 n=1 Tax=Eurytemora carolleeae TaxID=1294199 RepID=UPI000C768959|nr:uncharacterized protein LOC111703629 [Eurytemora carolleeae]|eukprot:XP_023331398.1 uncharacterized protein LOC111703629 [Eurytemora affinis]
MANSNPFLYPSLENPFLYKENPFLEKCSSPNLDQTLGIFIPFPAEDIPADFKTSWNVSHPELENIEDDFLVETTGSTLQTILGFEDRFLDLCVSTSDAKLDELDRTSEAIESKSIGALKISNDVDFVTKGGTLSEEANADSFEDLCKLEPGDIVEYGNYQAHGDSHVSGNGFGTETRSAKGPKALNNSGDKKKSKKKDPFPRKPVKKTPTGILIKNKMRKQGRVQDHLIKESNFNEGGQSKILYKLEKLYSELAELRRENIKLGYQNDDLKKEMETRRSLLSGSLECKCGKMIGSGVHYWCTQCYQLLCSATCIRYSGVCRLEKKCGYCNGEITDAFSQEHITFLLNLGKQ